ncbi:alpha/beta hydrolase [Gordonia sp. (in: high G+C Gram-positive bacteria)]|uniref:alpha/beta hydrolase n=1 Tax=Gordonia sp. (in: high G+C Gram-positive bacteria) TaxID=84139 RepID=UPI00261B196B|nr:alpha/beta hydrolase [Gordonia sp. (in: high G+C Gram-positive bacteria)]
MRSEERSLTGSRGRTIVYDVHRPDGDPVGVIALVHGLGEHAGRYGHVVSRLTGAGYLVVAPDHAGHGRSSGTLAEVRDFGDFGDDLHRVIAAVWTGDLPLYVLGHSMGGAIALRYALDHPNDLTGLVLSGPAVMPGDDLSPLMIKAAPVLGKLVPRLPAAALSASAVSRDPAVVAAYENDPLVWHGKIPAGLGGALIGAMGEFPARLPTLRVPTLALHGGRDVLANPDGTRMIGELGGGGDVTVKIYPELYHEIFNEPEQDEVQGDVLAWLGEHPGSSVAR